MKKLFFAILFTSILLLLGSIGFGCGESSPVSAPGTENVSDLPDRGGCILLTITMTDNTVQYWWISYYYKENGFYHLYNAYGFLISIDANYVLRIIETNHCNNNINSNK